MILSKRAACIFHCRRKGLQRKANLLQPPMRLIEFVYVLCFQLIRMVARLHSRQPPQHAIACVAISVEAS
jgi:hypothetical protein